MQGKEFSKEELLAMWDSSFHRDMSKGLGNPADVEYNSETGDIYFLGKLINIAGFMVPCYTLRKNIRDVSIQEKG